MAKICLRCHRDHDDGPTCKDRPKRARNYKQKMDLRSGRRDTERQEPILEDQDPEERVFFADPHSHPAGVLGALQEAQNFVNNPRQNSGETDVS